MTANGNGLVPRGDEARDVGDNDGRAEDSATEDVTNGAVGALPHLLELELCKQDGSMGSE